MNLPETAAASKPRRVNDRRSHQCARPGWRPPRRPPLQQAKIIAAAISRHRAAGNSCWLQPYEYTPDAETQALVHELLAAETPTAAMTREQWLTPSVEEEAAFDERSLDCRNDDLLWSESLDAEVN